MPAHGGRSSIGRARRSDGEAVTLANWLGNRLVDALAKAAAARSRVPARTRDLVATAAKAYSFCASKAGVATYKSNNCAHTAAGDDGQLRQQRLRDALPPEAVRMGTAHGDASDHPAPDPQASPTATPAASTSPPPAAAAGHRGHKAAAATAALKKKEAEREAAFTRTWLAERAQAAPRQPAGPTASERLEALRLRVRARQAAHA